MRTWRRRSGEDTVLDTVNYTLLTIIAFITFYPFYYILVLSFNSGADSTYGGVYLWPRTFTLENYIFFFQDINWLKGFFVSTARTVVGATMTVIFTCMMAYGLARNDLMFRRVYFMLVIIAMNFSGGLIAFYVVLRSLGLLNSFGVYVIPSMLNLFFLLIAISFFREIPSELGESARMDGASEILILIRIILPVSMPLLATMALFVGSGQWNAWLDSAYFVQNENLRTLTYRMIQVINQTVISADVGAANYTANLKVTQFSVQVTAMVISIAPIVCVYPFLQRYFVQGIMLGSVKG
ncbi:MAG: carbohydrate ABC transporter permease [Paenibacillaceae bacterium]